MILVDNGDILQQTLLTEDAFDKDKGAPLYFLDYMESVMNKEYGNFTPYEVKIPKSIDRLLRGDKEPARIIQVNEPFTYKGMFPIWAGNSTFGVNLRGIGYKNGDSRFPSTVVMNDTYIHMILAGATGQGKSVTMNSIVGSIAMEYAPWEVQIVMADAKLVEFKRYAGDKVYPHISAIAATTDTDYIVSVLTDLKEQMNLRYNMFTVYGVQNIMDFREVTGLALPRIVIPVDEFQAMFKNAGRQASLIEKLFDDYVRLGRATGFHLALASQEPDGIPKGTLGNITIRAALGCDARVSETLLGNDEAKMYKSIKGKLIVNTNASNADKKDNLHHQVPFQSGSVFEEMKSELSDLGDRVGFRYPLSFYDEAKVLNEEEFFKYIKSKGGLTDRIYLGEPSFVMRDSEGDTVLKVEIGGADIENILLFSSNPEELERYIKMMKYNVKAMGSKVISNVFTADRKMSDLCGLADIGSVFDIRESTDANFNAYVTQNVYRRLLCKETDEGVFGNAQKSEKASNLFYEVFEKGSPFDTELNHIRAHYVLGLLSTEKFIKGFGMLGLGKEALYDITLKHLKDVISYMNNSGFGDQKFQINQTKMVFQWIIGLDRIIGWGRDGKSGTISNLKKLLQDCAEANIRFIISTSSMEDTGELKSGIRYSLLEGLKASEANKVGCNEYPENKSKVLGILYDNVKRETVKFKKMERDDEILVG